MIHGKGGTGKAEIIVALDESSLDEAKKLMDRLEGRAMFYKVGLQLFTAAGPAAVEAVKRLEGRQEALVGDESDYGGVQEKAIRICC